MKRTLRPAITLFDLIVVVAILGLLAALMFPAVARVRGMSNQTHSMNNLRQLGLACNTYAESNNTLFPPGNDSNNFSAAAHLLPYIDQHGLYNKIDFKKPITDPANAEVRKVTLKLFLSPCDPIQSVSDDFGATNYLFNAGSKPSLKDNDGIFYQDSKMCLDKLAACDGAANTIMMGETLKGDGGKEATDVQRQHVNLDKDALDKLKDESGVEDFKNGKNIAGDRCASWMDGRFLQGTFTGTRTANDQKPDVNCDGKGGLSGLRSLDEKIRVLYCDGHVQTHKKDVDLKTWKSLTSANDGK